MREAALNLINAIKDAAVVCLSKELTVEDIHLLKTFITYVISGVTSHFVITVTLCNT